MASELSLFSDIQMKDRMRSDFKWSTLRFGYLRDLQRIDFASNTGHGQKQHHTVDKSDNDAWVEFVQRHSIEGENAKQFQTIDATLRVFKKTFNVRWDHSFARIRLRFNFASKCASRPPTSVTTAVNRWGPLTSYATPRSTVSSKGASSFCSFTGECAGSVNARKRFYCQLRHLRAGRTSPSAEDWIFQWGNLTGMSPSKSCHWTAQLQR